MSISEIESAIRDTTTSGVDDMSTVLQSETENSWTCSSCSALFKIADVGVSITLKKCKECLIRLHQDLESDSDSNDDENVLFIGPVQVNTTNIPDFIDENENDYPFEDENDNENINNISLEQIQNAMMLATTDKDRKFSIILNGAEETYKHFYDPVSGSKTRMLFRRESWDNQFGELYWYQCYGAMSTPKCILITPCVVDFKNGSRYCLMSIFETMCNRPRYDAIVVNMDSWEACIVKNIVSVVASVHLNIYFDNEKACRYKYNKVYDLFLLILYGFKNIYILLLVLHTNI